MFIVNEKLSLPDSEIEFTAIRASGSGGQNVNKVSSAMHLRFNIHRSSLSDTHKERLLALRDHRITKEGEIVIKAQRFRTQEKNRDDALQRFRELLAKVTITPLTRRPTRPTRASKRRRLDSKQRRSKVKATRRKVSDD